MPFPCLNPVLALAQQGAKVIHPRAVEATQKGEVDMYIKNTYNDNSLLFRLTTNGSLLQDEIIEYFVNNNFGLSISLDGPREEHNRNRILKNGEKTYDVVYQNIQKSCSDIADKILWVHLANPCLLEQYLFF